MADAPVPSIRITVNGAPHVVAATPETPLLYVLRNELGLNAAKFGCGLGICGACTVLLDGAAIRSCAVPVGEVREAPITTLEGLGSADRLHPVQQAFLDEQAAQCGYCTAGMVMEAVALLAADPNPSADAVREGLRDSLCRCGAHTRIVRAVRRAAASLAGEPEGAA